jgi:large subunit ribosomal protein L27
MRYWYNTWLPYVFGRHELRSNAVAHKKSGGSTNNGRDSNPQYRGIKLYSGETAKAGSIIIRQCGTKFKAGYMVKRGNDDTLFALEPGKVRFRGRFVDIVPSDDSIPQFTAVN